MAQASSLAEFRDFDEEDEFEQLKAAVVDAKTRNFAIEFDSAKAYAAQNLTVGSMERFLSIERPKHSSARWMYVQNSLVHHGSADFTLSNIWAPDQQQELVMALSKHYKFSPRLRGIMCSNHGTTNPALSNVSVSNRSGVRLRGVRTQLERKSVESQSVDLEKDGMAVPKPLQPPTLDLSHYKMVQGNSLPCGDFLPPDPCLSSKVRNPPSSDTADSTKIIEVWHFCSVDWNKKYLCIGYNSLCDTRSDFEHQGTQSSEDGSGSTKHVRDKPRGQRTWTWLVLCDDGTVISIHENPFPGHKGGMVEGHQPLLTAIRRNLLNVFMQLSSVTEAHRKSNPINTLDIRPGLLSTQSSNITIADSPSLLFYYLFDDWYSSYALVAKSEHQYAMQLEKLRGDMFTRPQVPLIQKLHQYGRELAVLKRMYQSYELIIERILDRQKPLHSSDGDPSSISGSHLEDSPSEGGITSRMQTFGAPLSSAATVRFERLRDRIKLYALSEIQECLDEKESLVFLNFNLITLKESQAVERLTRITILLAKVTILFMPVSLMTAYFSTQLSDLANIYSIKTYWICFAVIMSLSFVGLALFGVASGTLEGKPIYRSFTQTIVEAGKGRWKARRGRKSREE